MKRLLKFATAAALGLALAAFGITQGAGPKGGATGGDQGGIQGGQKGQRGQGLQRMAKMRQEIMAKLNLTPDQKRKIEGLNKSFKADLKNLREAPGDRKAKMPKMQELMQKHREAVGALLTPEQKKKFEELMKEAMDKARSGKNPPPGGNGGTKPPPPLV